MLYLVRDRQFVKDNNLDLRKFRYLKYPVLVKRWRGKVGYQEVTAKDISLCGIN